MYWIALLPAHDEERQAWSWRALQFTPRVAEVDEALLLEASAALRLWRGRKGLLNKLFIESSPLAPAHWADGRTSLTALAWLRLHVRGEPVRRRRVDDLPIDVLSAAREHVSTLERIGCRSWGDLRRLPRAGVVRRFGAALLDALDRAYGERPQRYRWLELPEAFDVNLELPALATSAAELMWTAQRLLSQMQVWLQARNRGVLALELEWTLDLRRLNGVRLPSHEQLVIRTAQPTQDTAHLRRLIGEHLARAALAAPANHLRMRSLETVPWPGANRSVLPDDNPQGEVLHQFIERLSARLGEANVLIPQAHGDHRPERMQSWKPAKSSTGASPIPGRANESGSPVPRDALCPEWLLPAPLQLEVHGDKPHYHGPLRLVAGPQRLETGWWDCGDRGPASRDYFIARSDEAGLLWVYREHLAHRTGLHDQPEAVRWYLHGWYA